MTATIRPLAREIKAKLDETRCSLQHAPALKEGIMRIAEACGTQLQQPAANANGELSIITVQSDPGGGCLPYGEQFAELLNSQRCRTGELKYGYTAIMLPCNGWCYMPYRDVEALIIKAAK